MAELTTIVTLFVVLVFLHFIADWVFQTHFEAVNKTKNAYIRFIHCVIYATLVTVPLTFIVPLSLTGGILAYVTLLVSHFIIDTYIPVYLWAKYLRRIPNLTKENFASHFKHPVHVILFIMIDQLAHISFLWVVAYIILFL
jgi:hypothetical protein